MMSTFLPRLGVQLGGRTRLAYLLALLAPMYLRDAAADSAFPPSAYFESKPYIGERFIEENTAIA